MTPLSRREFLGAAATLGAGALRTVRPGGFLVGPRSPVREYRLTARPTDWDTGGGSTAPAWTYNGTVPGPELRVREGETLRVVLHNELPEPTTIHWHGVPVPFPMDGVPDLTQPAVAPGGRFTYEFVPRVSGTYWYHTHVGYQLDRGLYGVLIVEPGSEALSYDQEYTLVFDDWLRDPDHPRPNPNASGMMGMEGMMGGMGGMMSHEKPPASDQSHHQPSRVEPLYDGLIVNGRGDRTASELRVRRGDRVRLRLVNAGSAFPLRIQVGGHEMELTHADGQLIVPRKTRAVALGMGERWDVLIEARHPGLWPLTATAPGGERVTMLIRYEGVRSTRPEPAPREAEGEETVSYDELSGATPAAVPVPDRVYYLVLSGGMMDPTRWTINGRMHPNTDPIPVRLMERVRLRLTNMSMMPHPMHLHGHFFQLLSFNGRRLSSPIRKDTIMLGHMEGGTLDVVADNPGARWLFHCHNLYHHLAGMATELRYTGGRST
ncbi:MAG: multicopper oxidase family protein [Gemmatimonadales bacterium]